MLLHLLLLALLAYPALVDLFSELLIFQRQFLYLALALGRYGQILLYVSIQLIVAGPEAFSLLKLHLVLVVFGGQLAHHAL